MGNRHDFLFLDLIIKGFLLKVDKGEEQLNNVYKTWKMYLNSQLKKTPERAEEIKEHYEILDKVYQLFLDEPTRDRISESNISAKALVERWGETLVNDNQETESNKVTERNKGSYANTITNGNEVERNQRTYEMEDLFDESFIHSHQEGEQKVKDIHFDKKQSKKYIFYDKTGKRIQIQNIGELSFKNGFGVKKTILQYRVQQLVGTQYRTDDVFSNISMQQMEESEYKRVILHELLSDNNIDLSKTRGYIGNIISANTVAFLKEGQEQKQATGYTYRIDEKYCLEYDAEELSAVMIYQQELEKIKKMKQNILEYIIKEAHDETAKEKNEGEER